MEAGDTRFREIYRTHSWEGGSRSGPGSDPGKAAPYLRLLQGFIDDPANRVGSIVDLGCGDWAWTRHVRFGNRRYAGFDVVPELVQKLERDHGSELVRFAVADAGWSNLPDADLLLVKDVLQHLSTERVRRFMTDVLPRYRLALITNDVARFHLPWWPLPWPRRAVGTVNSAVEDGGWCPLDVTQPPFSIVATPLLTFGVKVSWRTLDVKRTVLHRR